MSECVTSSAGERPSPAPSLVGRVGQQSDRPRALDRRLKFSLMKSAGSRNPPGKDLASLGNEGREQLHVLPVDVFRLLRAKLADLAAADEELLASRRLSFAVSLRAVPAVTSRASHRRHGSLRSAGAVSAGGGAAGRGGRLAAFTLSRSAVLAARFSSSSARTAR